MREKTVIYMRNEKIFIDITIYIRKSHIKRSNINIYK